MTSTSEPCACGCGRPVGPKDNHPFFSTPCCQKLWMASQSVPEPDRVSWRSRQRFFCELWFTAPWGTAGGFDAPVDDRLMVQVANGVLYDHFSTLRPFADSELEDALRLLVHRWNVVRSGGFYQLRDVLPGWATSRRRVVREEAVDRVRVPSAATLDSVRLPQAAS